MTKIIIKLAIGALVVQTAVSLVNWFYFNNPRLWEEKP